MAKKASPKPASIEKEAVVEETVAPAEDRSAYNCQSCSGEGMLFTAAHPEGEICAQCNGTGKV